MKYENVLIIGNGFDLDLGLKTRYSDFLKSSEFADILNIIPSGLGKYLKIHSEKDKWLDLELLIGKYVNEKYSLKKEDFETDFSLFKNALILYLRRIQDKSIIQESIAYQLINRVKNDKNFIINFNYTHSIEKIFNSLLPNSSSIIPPHPIHGTLSGKNIVIGVDDTAKIPKEYNDLLKKPYRYRGNSDIPSSFKNCSNLIIFGHSIGATDFSFFKDVFSLNDLANKKRKIVIIDYGETDKIRIIQNLAAIVGEENIRTIQNSNIEFFNVQQNNDIPENLLNSKKGFIGLQYL